MSEVKSLQEIVLQKAAFEVGKQEIPKGSNWGVNVQKYLSSVGVTFPASWCMAFVYWCYEQGYSILSKPNELTKTAGVLDAWNKTGHSHRVTTPLPGDIFIMDFGSGHGHAGIVESVHDGHIFTIEGNSNDNGSREGYEVCRKPNGRSISSCKGFLRFT